MEHVQLFNQLNLSETRCSHWNPKRNVYCDRDRGHGVLMLWTEFPGFTPRHVKLWPSQRDGVYFM